MQAKIFLLFTLLSCACAQYMSTWGSSGGFSNQMHGMGMPYGHGMHWGGMRESMEGASSQQMPATAKTETVIPFHIFRTKIPSRTEYQDVAVLNVNAPAPEEQIDHLIYKQSPDLKRPVMGVLSLIPTGLSQLSQMTSGMMKSSSGMQDTLSDDLMTCVDMAEPMKMYNTEPIKMQTNEPRIIITRGLPYYMQSMHRMKV